MLSFVDLCNFPEKLFILYKYIFMCDVYNKYLKFPVCRAETVDISYVKGSIKDFL